MVGGPTLGRGKVEVNMQMDEGSINTVGKQIHKQLSSLSQRLVGIGEQNTRVYQAIGRDAVLAWRSALGAAVTSAPLIGSAMSGLAGGATMLGGALYSVGQSSGALLPIMTSLGVAGYTASIGLNNFATAVGETNPKALNELLETMPKSMQNAVMATRSLSNEMRAAVWPVLFKGLTDGIEQLRDTGVIQRGLGLMAEQMNGLAKSVLNYANTKQGVKTLNSFFENNAKVFGALSKAAVPFLDGFLRLTNALTPSAIRFAGTITDIGKRFQSWTQGEGFAKRIDESMRSAQKTAGLFFGILGNLGSALRNVFTAAGPSTDKFLQMLTTVTQKFEDWTGSVAGQNTIAQWAAQSVDVMRQFGSTAEAVFKVIAELADPRVIISFLKTVEGAFEILGKLPLDSLVSAFVSISEALQPVSSLFLAIIIAGASLNIMIGSLLGQFGGLFSVLSKIIQFKILTNILRGTAGGAGAAGAAAGGAAAKVGLLSRAWSFLVGIFNKVKAAFSSVVGFFTKTNTAVTTTATQASRLGNAFKPVMSILGRFAKFAGPVGLAVWIGTLIGKSDDLQSKFGELWDAMKEVGSAIGGAFSEIGAALSPLAPAAKAVGNAVGPVFGFLDKIATLAIGVVIDAITFAFKSLANVIEGAGKIIAGVINILMGIFTLDFGKVLDGLKQVFSGIGPLLQGLFGLLISFFAPARLAGIAVTAFRGLFTGIKAATPTVLGAVGGIVSGILRFLVSLPGRLLSLGLRAITSLGGAVVRGTPKVLAAAGRIVAGVLRWIGRLPGRLLSLGIRAITSLGGAVIKNTPKVLAAAGRIFTGVVKWIAKLPGKLLDLGRDALVRLLSAIVRGTGKVLSAAGKIFTGIVKALIKLPGKLLELGKSAITKIGGALSDGIGKARDIMGRVFDAVTGAIAGLPQALYNAGSEMIGRLAAGLTSKLSSVVSAAKNVADKIKGVFPGSPVKEGPLTAWNYGSDASGGGRNIIDSLAKGLRNLNPIDDAMNDIANSVGMGVRAPGVRGGRGGRAGGSSDSGNFPRRLVLRIGERDFVAYVSDIADGRIDAADSLAWQGA